MSNEQLSLFGAEYAPSTKEKNKKKESSSNSSAKTSNSQARSIKDQNIEIDLDFTVHYATRLFTVADFITDIPESGKVNLKLLREKMELEFVRP